MSVLTFAAFKQYLFENHASAVLALSQLILTNHGLDLTLAELDEVMDSELQKIFEEHKQSFGRND